MIVIVTPGDCYYLIVEAYFKRRVFINKGRDRYQIFSFIQDKDGSIYCASPNFADAKWVSYDKRQQELIVKTTGDIGDGKISLHGTGMTAIRNNSNPNNHQLIIRGNQLFNHSRNEVGARHLFTTFMREPNYIPTDLPFFNRKSDYSMQANEDLMPFVLIFFAIPQQGITTNFLFSLSTDEMLNVPNDFLGMHFFSLRYHDVFWFAYRTKNMDKWPKYTHFCYDDGYSVPVFIGEDSGRLILELRQPMYLLKGKVFTIDCTHNLPPNW